MHLQHAVKLAQPLPPSHHPATSMQRPFPLRFRRPLRHVFAGVAIVAGAVLALAGAVVALLVLAIGALAHGVWTGLRATQRPAAPRNDSGRVIEGEYAVVGRPPLRSGEPR